jgi:ribosomal protein L40E
MVHLAQGIFGKQFLLKSAMRGAARQSPKAQRCRNGQYEQRFSAS